jgi:hypothetical protein
LDAANATNFEEGDSMRAVIYGFLMMNVLLALDGCYDRGYYRGYERNDRYERQRDRDYDWDRRNLPPEERSFETDRWRRELPEGD